MNRPMIQGSIEYSHNNKIEKVAFGPSLSVLGPSISVFSTLDGCAGGFIFTLRIKPQDVLILRDIAFTTDLVSSRDDRVFLNGYQSWTDTKEFTRKDVMKGPSKFFAPLTEKFRVTRYADYEFQPYSGKRGDFHGSSYGWVRGGGENVRFFGSLDEKTGFTFFHVNMNKKTMLVRKDCRDLEISEEYTAFSILFSEGTVDETMDGYFGEMGIKALPARPCTGWTSWYNYYQNISETIILENLASYRDQKLPIDIFQIDDGYQTAVGDWLSVNDRFPSGMKNMADKIKEAGFTPGIWLAPFAGETVSALFSEHRSWFIAEENGEPFCTGGNWSSFYSLDLYNDDARAYISHVFDVVLNEWGFDLVKLDFLYGVCIKPRRNKTRGQIMSDAMDFLRECVGTKQILGCGVPLWSAFGKVEYCRIGTDIDLQWHNKLYSRIIHREFPSTKYALENSVFRRHLDGRAFINDPDVFLLRHTNIKLTGDQRRTVFYINNIFGNLLFTSDDIREYTDEERALYISSFPLTFKKIRSVTFDGGLYTAVFTIGNLEYFFVSNHGEKARKTKLPDNLYFRAGSDPETGNAWAPPLSVLAVRPFGSECFLKCTPESPWSVLGTTMSAFPGSELGRIAGEKNEVTVAMSGKNPSEGHIILSVPKNNQFILINGKKTAVESSTAGGKDLYYIRAHSSELQQG